MNKRIKELRLKLDLSQEEFGSKINIKSRAHISLLESGDRVVTDRIVNDICREFNVNENWLRYGEGVMINAESDFIELIASQIDELDEMDIKFITEYVKLRSNHKKVIKDFIQKMTT